MDDEEVPKGSGFTVAFLGPKGSYCHQVCGTRHFQCLTSGVIYAYGKSWEFGVCMMVFDVVDFK